MKSSMNGVHEVVDNIYFIWMDVKSPEPLKLSHPSKSIECCTTLFYKYVIQTLLERCMLGSTSKIVIALDESTYFITKVGLSVQTVMLNKVPDTNKSNFESFF